MKHVVVPEVATDKMKQAAIWACDYRIGGDAAENAFRPENLEDKCPIQAAIAAAPDTGMIAVDKVKTITAIKSAHNFICVVIKAQEGLLEETLALESYKTACEIRDLLAAALKDMEA